MGRRVGGTKRDMDLYQHADFPSLNMLNNDDKDVRELARSSLFLDLRRHKVPLGRETEPQFLGFKRKPSGKLDTLSAGFGVWSDWPDLNDLCVRTGVSLECVRSDSERVRVLGGYQVAMRTF